MSDGDQRGPISGEEIAAGVGPDDSRYFAMIKTESYRQSQGLSIHTGQPDDEMRIARTNGNAGSRLIGNPGPFALAVRTFVRSSFKICVACGVAAAAGALAWSGASWVDQTLESSGSGGLARMAASTALAGVGPRSIEEISTNSSHMKLEAQIAIDSSKKLSGMVPNKRMAASIELERAHIYACGLDDNCRNKAFQLDPKAPELFASESQRFLWNKALAATANEIPMLLRDYCAYPLAINPTQKLIGDQEIQCRFTLSRVKPEFRGPAQQLLDRLHSSRAGFMAKQLARSPF